MGKLDYERRGAKKLDGFPTERAQLHASSFDGYYTERIGGPAVRNEQSYVTPDPMKERDDFYEAMAKKLNSEFSTDAILKSFRCKAISGKISVRLPKSKTPSQEEIAHLVHFMHKNNLFCVNIKKLRFRYKGPVKSHKIIKDELVSDDPLLRRRERPDGEEALSFYGSDIFRSPVEKGVLRNLELDQQKPFVYLVFKSISEILRSTLQTKWNTNVSSYSVFAPLYVWENHKEKKLDLCVLILPKNTKQNQPWMVCIVHENGEVFRFAAKQSVQNSEKSWKAALSSLMAMPFWSTNVKGEYQSWYDRYQIKFHAPMFRSGVKPQANTWGKPKK